ncbi:hypothetical protein E3N88_09403 [Mikania micrantha]|uniref:NB-ARC domain-containing protein n=1 Tax=Mikania micrantha TaxID=192012 RepID=A0A5N6PJU4_9ASTR|nr:hypothetical protein E3N88_09403 [Mikania micrantha]
MEIVDTIYNKLDYKEVHLPLNMTRMWTCYKEINSWLDQHNLEFLAIYGMEGSGKTTLAKCIYDSVWKTFENASFVEDIGDDGAWFCKVSTTTGVDLMYNPIVFGKPEFEVRGWRKTGRPKQVNPSFTELKTVRCIIDGPELEDVYKIGEMSKLPVGDKTVTFTSSLLEEGMNGRMEWKDYKPHVLYEYEPDQYALARTTINKKIITKRQTVLHMPNVGQLQPPEGNNQTNSIAKFG